MEWQSLFEGLFVLLAILFRSVIENLFDIHHRKEFIKSVDNES
jgi:hypothetical protein